MEDGAVKKERRTFLTIAAIAFSGGTALIALRTALTGRFYYFFLVWNLFLALVPYGLSVAILTLSRGEKGRRTYAAITVLALLWLVFYPNAPYLFTDFIHLVNRTWLRGRFDVFGKDTLLWFDLVLCSAFAYVGHMVGLLSIDLMLRSLHGLVSPWKARTLVGCAIVIAGLGLYVGRFVRFNSWDLFLDPVMTASGIAPHLDDPRTLLLSGVFSAFILLTYVVHRLSRR